MIKRLLFIVCITLAACSNKQETVNEYIIVHNSAVKGNEALAEGDSIKISNHFLSVSIPNPLKSNANFSYSIAGSADITIDILDQKMDLVYRMNIEKNAGEHTCFLKYFDMRGQGINPGKYYLEVKAKAQDGKLYKEIAQVEVISGN